MEINRNNYEIYILDYIEGNLPLDIRNDFEYFLDINPDLKAEINDFEEINLEPVSVSFFPKGLLKKDPETDMAGISKFEQLSISSLENEIKKEEINELNQILANSPDKQIEFETFKKTKLIPDFTINYPFKQQLKHKLSAARFTSLIFYTSIAASVALMLGIALFYQSSNMEIKGKALSYQANTQKYEIRQVENIQSEIYSFNNPETIITQIDSEVPLIDSTPIDYVNSRQLASLENTTVKVTDIENIAYYRLPSNNGTEEDYITMKEFLNKQIKEKILKQPVNDKITLVSVGKAFSRGLSKILRKDIKLDEKVMKDGSKLYAFKAGTFEIYANSKPSKRADQPSNEKNQNKSNSLKE